MDDFEHPTQEHFLFRTVRVQVKCRRTGQPLEQVIVRVADSHEAALGQRCGAVPCVTGCDGTAEVDVPVGFVVFYVGRKQIQEGWVGVDQVMEFDFTADRKDVTA
jgi:hypothetical protein